MKTYALFRTIVCWLLFLVFAVCFTSCEKDSDGDMPVILRVRTTNPELTDSTFVQGSPGQMIVIEGENLGTAKTVTINDQEVYFNPNYVTSRSIIVTIPSELELTGTNADLPKEIKVETNGGIATYNFHVLSPEPFINRIQITYPVTSGDIIIIHGENFYEIEKIVFEGEFGADISASQFIVSRTYSNITLNLPNGVDAAGDLVVYCASGEARFPYATIVQPPTINSISSDMPVIGAEFFITGTYFINVEKVSINGEYDILAEDLIVSESTDTIYLKLPVAPTKAGNITITAAGGNTNSSKMFYPIEYLVADYDNIGSVSWAGSTFTGDGVNRPYVTTGIAGGVIEQNVGEHNGWFGNLLTNIEFADAIADDVPVSDLVIRFECFMAYPMSSITFQVMFGSDWDSAYSNYVPKSIASGTTEIGRWMSCEIPISFVVKSDITDYSDVKSLGTEIGLFSKNGSEAVPLYEFYCDNFRIMRKILP